MRRYKERSCPSSHSARDQPVNRPKCPRVYEQSRVFLQIELSPNRGGNLGKAKPRNRAKGRREKADRGEKLKNNGRAGAGSGERNAFYRVSLRLGGRHSHSCSLRRCRRTVCHSLFRNMGHRRSRFRRLDTVPAHPLTFRNNEEFRYCCRP